MDIRWQGIIYVKAPVEQVYRYLADFRRHSEWAQTLERVEKIQEGDGLGVGAQYRAVERQSWQTNRKPREPLTSGQQENSLCEVQELVPPHRIAWNARSLSKMGAVNAEYAFGFAPDPEGGTWLTQTASLHSSKAADFRYRLVYKTTQEEFEQRARAQWEAGLENIKQILEEFSSSATKVSMSF
jgi:uncharacterized protein YndB with AHSA1/START domain